MPEGSIPLLAAIIILIFLSGFFSATETAYSCVNKIKLKSMSNNGDKKAANVLNLTDNYETLLTTILIGNNIVNLTAATLSALFFGKIIQNGVDSSVVSTIVLTIVILIFGEITPKFLAKAFPEKIAFLTYPLIMFFYYILFPLNLIFRGYQKLIAICFRVKDDDAITDEELMTIVDEAEEDGTLKEDESDLIRSALEFDDLQAGDILIPRVEVEAVSYHENMDKIRAIFKESGYSRLIVYKGNIDNVIGFIHEKEFYEAYLNGKKSLDGMVQNLLFTSEHTRISELLKKLQKRKLQLAIVTDEYGGMLGLVTLEDILEELVGEIWDEHDEEDVPIVHNQDGSFTVEGKCDLDYFFEQVGWECEAESNSVGGWITEQLGEIPLPGRKFVTHGYEILVSKANRKCVLQAIVKPIQDKEEQKIENKQN